MLKVVPERFGSSPRVRGKRDRRRHRDRRPGLIPARAGKTPSGEPRPRGRGAHPRACGKNARLTLWPPARRGSSPRVRGKLFACVVVWGLWGLIPARAGKTPVDEAEQYLTEAHPRACGENLHRSGPVPPHRGSSPRVRGKPTGRPWHRGGGGLIPARAGKTIYEPHAHGAWGAHPRACGENSASDPPWLGSTGSSPRVRGKHEEECPPEHQPGLIPARAGKTAARDVGVGQGRAHPRACGENKNDRPSTTRTPGSSPRVRGKREEDRRDRPHLRLIPARAGKTHVSSPPSSRGAAHPRACGENIMVRSQRHHRTGSSPRVRGKQTVPRRRPADGGLIPARAGKTHRRSRRTRSSWAHPRACGEN